MDVYWGRELGRVRAGSTGRGLGDGRLKAGDGSAKKVESGSAYIIFKMFSFRLKPNLRKPDVLQFTRCEAEICDERLPEAPRL